ALERGNSERTAVVSAREGHAAPRHGHDRGARHDALPAIARRSSAWNSRTAAFGSAATIVPTLNDTPERSADGVCTGRGGGPDGVTYPPVAYFIPFSESNSARPYFATAA